jgi:hypothetical protein
MLAGLLGLAACGSSDPYRFAPPCPVPSIIADAADVTQFRPLGHDLTDIVFTARITGLRGTCSPAEHDATRTLVKLTVALEASRGAAGRGQQDVVVPYFVAVVDGDTILVKDPQLLAIHFPSNVDHITVTSPEIDLNLPTTKDKSAVAFKLMSGFQLSPEQLAYNRAHSGQH